MSNNKADVLFAVQKLTSQLVYNMAKAEGNTHTIADVITIVGKTHQELQQVIQINKAWDSLIELVESDQFDFNKQIACELNQLVASADFYRVGCFRDRNVQIAGTDYEPPPFFATVPRLWNKLEYDVKVQSDRDILPGMNSRASH